MSGLTKQEAFKESKSLIKALIKQPALAISLSYLMLTLCGIFYSWEFYKQFDVAFLKLANISDLMTIALSEPAAILMFFSAVVVVLFIEWTSPSYERCRDRLVARPKSMLRSILLKLFLSMRDDRFMSLWLILIFVLYANSFVSVYASWQAHEIKQGNGDNVIVGGAGDELENPDLQSAPAKVALLGSTTNFVMVYNADSKSARVIPIEAINSIDVLPKTEQKNRIRGFVKFVLSD